MDDNISVSSDQNLQGLPITQQSPNFSPSKKWSLIPAISTCPFHIFQTQASLSITTASIFVQPTSSVTWSTAIETSVTLFYSSPSTCKVICNCVWVHVHTLELYTWTAEFIWNEAWSHLSMTVLLIAVSWYVLVVRSIPHIVCDALYHRGLLPGLLPSGWFHSRLWKMEGHVSGYNSNSIHRDPSWIASGTWPSLTFLVSTLFYILCKFILIVCYSCCWKHTCFYWD